MLTCVMIESKNFVQCTCIYVYICVYMYIKHANLRTDRIKEFAFFDVVQKPPDTSEHLFVYMYVCIHACIYICMYAYMHVCMYVYT